ncbi:hypothetical protein [Pseudoroseicyclus sp. CXY001]|uniref:hypothetical protein n=1 Tax=Pseudoroseicyclus sp. CXY001 TaxID=3242492 RepID=UPI0035715B9D
MGYSTPKKPFDLKEFLERPPVPGRNSGYRRFRSIYSMRKKEELAEAEGKPKNAPS